MPMERVDEMTSPPIVGRYYLVPCVWVPQDSPVAAGWRAVLGPRHEDREALGFPYLHFHNDPRFLSDAVIDRIRSIAGHRQSIFDCVITGVRGIEYRRRRCLREMPEVPAAWGQDWRRELQRLNGAATLRGPCKVCPHRGVPLASLPVAADGTVTCPGHGLRWNVSTGRLVRRTSP